MEGRFCPICLFPLSEEAPFCAHCGAWLCGPWEENGAFPPGDGKQNSRGGIRLEGGDGLKRNSNHAVLLRKAAGSSGRARADASSDVGPTPRKRSKVFLEKLLKHKKGQNAPSGGCSTREYFGCLVLLAIPVIGWIVGGFWSLGFFCKKNKQNLARAVLSFWGVVLSLGLVLGVFFRTPLMGAIEGFFNGTGGGTVTCAPGGLGSHASGEHFSPENELLSPDSNVLVHFSGFSSADCLNLLMSEQYYIQYTSFAFGVSIYREQARGQGWIASLNSVGGVTTRTLQLDGVLYECNDEEKRYCLLGQGTASGTLPFGGTLSALKRVGSGTGQVDGIDCEYDEFQLQSGSAGQAERTVRLYVADGVLQAIYMEEPLLGGEVMMRVHTLSKTVPEGMLELPDDYLKVNYDEMLHPSMKT